MNLGHVSVPIRRFERLTPQKPPALPGDRYLVFAGFVRGHSGPNRFGPAPNGVAPVRKQQAEAGHAGASNLDAIIAWALAARSVAAVKAGATPGAALVARTRSSSRSAPTVFGKRR
jgi:hypothetical protein